MRGNHLLITARFIKNFFSLQAKKGYMTESETDTEVIVKLLKLIYDRDQKSENETKLSFAGLVEQVLLQLVSIIIIVQFFPLVLILRVSFISLIFNIFAYLLYILSL